MHTHKIKVRGCNDIKKRAKVLQNVIRQTIDSLLKTYDMQCIQKDELYCIPAQILETSFMLNRKQLEKWNGLRWRKFTMNKKSAALNIYGFRYPRLPLLKISYQDWLKRGKCWQDQNQHKILAPMFANILLHFQSYCHRLAITKYGTIGSGGNEDIKNILPVIDGKTYVCKIFGDILFFKCFAEILSSDVQFERTRKTPIIPQSVFKNGKYMQSVLREMHHGFTVEEWLNQVLCDLCISFYF